MKYAFAMLPNKWNEHDWEATGYSGDMFCHFCRQIAWSQCWDEYFAQECTKMPDAEDIIEPMDA